MTLRISIRSLVVTSVSIMLVLICSAGAQRGPVVRDTLPEGPLVFDFSGRGPAGNIIPGKKFRVVPLRGLTRPYALAFLPDGRILISERGGRLRIVSNGVLDAQPIAGVPAVLDRSMKGLNDVVLHPRFAENQWIYFTYFKPVAGSNTHAKATLARARFDGGHALTDVRDIFSTDALVDGPSAARAVFGRDGKIYMAIGIPIPRAGNATVVGNAPIATVTDAQDPNSYFGKVLRLNDDGTAPGDNPFSGKPGHKPELYALGIRNAMGLYVHPDTGELWETENGPQDGDEINIIRAGKNYGWPVISYGRAYTGELTGGTGPTSGQPFAPGLEQPFLFWAPSIAPAGITFYTADRLERLEGQHFSGRPWRRPTATDRS